MDDVAGPGALHGTHRNHAGELTGAVIDYMLATKEFSPLSRTQSRSVADHDLITYDFSWKDDLATFMWPPRSKLTATEVTTERWELVWQDFQPDFDKAINNGDSNLAWECLSSAAEAVLGGKTSLDHARHNCPMPQIMKQLQSTKAPNFQSLLERQRRRLLRKIQQSLIQPHSELLFRKFQQFISVLSVQVPEVTNCQWASEDSAQLVLKLANQEAQKAAQERICKWKDAISADVPRLANWIKARSEEVEPNKWNPDPQLQAEKWAQKWEDVWNPDETLLKPAFEQCLSFLLSQPDHPFTPLSGGQLQRLCHKAIKKAASLDCWYAKMWDCLPVHFFELLAGLWNSCLQGAPLPEQWKHVRISLIPKSDGGKHPLAIAALA